MTRHQMIFTTNNVVKQAYVQNTQVVTPAPRSIARGINSNPNTNSFFRGLVFPSKAGCGSCGR